MCVYVNICVSVNTFMCQNIYMKKVDKQNNPN